MEPSQDDLTSGPTQDPDAPLVEQAIGGSRPAFEELYRRYVRRVHSLVSRMVGSGHDAEEVTQEVFFQAYRNLTGFQGRSRFYTWLFRIATNVSLQYVKRQVRDRRQSSFDEMVENQASGLPTAPASQDPEREVESREFRAHLIESIGLLPPNQRAVIVLGPILGHTYEQMSEILGATVEVVKARLHRARENVRIAMRSERTT